MKRRRDPRRDPIIQRHYHEMVERILPYRNALCHHPVYGMVEDPEAMTLFMRSHVFAVWDFMSLLKSLQRSLTGLTHPWVPPEDCVSARLVNEIVLEEETDEVLTGFYISHLELYLDAMDEVGADRGPIDEVLDGLRENLELDPILCGLDVPLETREFVRFTLHAAQLPVHQVAAVFLMGREDVIPAMFLNILKHEQQGGGPPRRLHLRARSLLSRVIRSLERRYSPREVEVPLDAGKNVFRTYLERHIELDGESHGPMGRRLLMQLCGKDPTRWQEATDVAIEALHMRYKLWDGVMAELQHMRVARHDARVRGDRATGVPPLRRQWTWGSKPPGAYIRALPESEEV